MMQRREKNCIKFPSKDSFKSFITLYTHTKVQTNDVVVFLELKVFSTTMVVGKKNQP